MSELLILVVGIAIGAAFSPFWMKVYDKLKERAQELSNK